MPRVLIATDEPDFTMGLVEGYRSLGWEVVTGTANFRIRAARFDVVHHQWPEELSNWRVPDRRQLGAIVEHLAWWRQHAINIFTVNNLYPHQHHRHPAYRELYSAFYTHCQVITHYTTASHELVLDEFPEARRARHVVHAPASYEVTLATQVERGSRRAKMGIAADEFVILAIGSLRSWDEVRLIKSAYDLVRAPGKRLLMAGKVVVQDSPWRLRAGRFAWNRWLRRRRAVVEPRRVPENEISRFVDTCDVAIVPRLTGLNSGIIFLAMTFGRPVISPDLPGYLGALVGTRNPVYRTGSAPDLALRIDEAAAMDLKAIGEENARVASTWTWKETVRKCLAAAYQRDEPGSPWPDVDAEPVGGGRRAR